MYMRIVGRQIIAILNRIYNFMNNTVSNEAVKKVFVENIEKIEVK